MKGYPLYPLLCELDPDSILITDFRLPLISLPFRFLYEQEYKVYSYFRQRWKDPRLAGKINHTLVIKGSDIGNIWVPDPYCYNARESNMMMPDEEIHSSVSIQPTGDVLYSKG